MDKKLSGKYGQKLIDNAKESARDSLTTISKKLNQKHLLIWLEIKLLIRITISEKLTSETVPSEIENIGFDVKIPKGRSTSPEKPANFWWTTVSINIFINK